MNKKIISEAIGNISNRHIEEAADFQVRKKKPVRVKWGAVAACLCLMLLVVIPFFNQTNVSPFALTAYALEDDGTLTSHEMQLNESVTLKEIQLEAGFNGFLFSYPMSDQEQMSRLTFISSKYFPEKPGNELYDFMEDKGQEYFYFIPDENEEMPVQFNINITDENGEQYKYEIVIEKGNNDFTATLVGFNKP